MPYPDAYFAGVRILGPHTKGFKSEIHGASVFMGVRIQPWIRLTDFYASPETMLIGELGPEAKVKDILGAIPLSKRQVQRRFKSFTGLSIKQYLDILRFRRATTALYQQNSPLSDAILEQGYFDQSHYLNTFKVKMSQSSRSFQEYISGIKTRLVEE